MDTPILSEANFTLWLLLNKVSHSIVVVRERELRKFHIPARQLLVLHTIQALGPNATLSEVSKKVDREIHVISRQATKMAKDGLLKKIKDTPKSNLLRFELTDKGSQMAKLSSHSESINVIFSTLSAEERQNMESALKILLIKVKEYSPVLGIGR